MLSTVGGGVNLSSDLDGVDQWASIKEEKEKSPHQFVIHNIDQDDDRGTWQVCWKLEPLNIFNYICPFPNF